jgi:cell division protein FtsW
MSSDRPAASTRHRTRSLFNPASIIIVCALGLSFLGLTILFSASAWFKNKQGVAVPYQYLEKQIVGVVVAGFLCWVASRLNLDYLRRYAWWIAGALLVLLLLVLIPNVGISVKGSQRWLGFGAARLQVSEFAKLGLVFCLAHYLALNQTRIGELRRGFLYPLAIIGAFAVLVLCEPDFGTAALMIAVGLVMLFLAGARWRFVAPTIALVGAAFALLVAHNPNRLRRLLEFLSE